MRRLAVLSRLGLVLGLVLGCKTKPARGPGQDPSGPGFIDTSSIDLDAGPPPPIDPSDLERVARRGVELYWMEHGMQLAYEVGLPRVGKSVSAALLPLASIDEGAHSGQVEFYRWRPEDVPESGELDPQRAQRWLVVPFLLRPDRVLENEQFSEELDPKSDEAIMIAAVVHAALAARQAHAAGRWHMHPFRESRRDGTRRIRSTRVYMFGLDGNSPDLEVLVVDPEKKRADPRVAELTIVHAPDERTGASVRVRQSSPGPLSVARAKALGQPGAEVAVHGADGSRWRISTDTGAIELATQTPSG